MKILSIILTFLSASLISPAQAASLIEVCAKIIQRQALSHDVGFRHPYGDSGVYTLGGNSFGIKLDDRYALGSRSGNKYVTIEAKWLDSQDWTTCSVSRSGLVSCNGMFTTTGSGVSNGYTTIGKILGSEGPRIDEGVQKLSVTSFKDPNTTVDAVQTYASLEKCKIDTSRKPIDPPYGEVSSPMPNMKKIPISLVWTAVYELEQFDKEFQIMYSYNGYTVPFIPLPKGF